ncbi:transglutaminase domain-containing protein [Pontibacter populi]|uniref:Transglutaminase domain-containing protein n=1 Tax=Pontibacter populi TaxID=890055 RepID=A0ABV1RY27_9BACT
MLSTKHHSFFKNRLSHFRLFRYFLLVLLFAALPVLQGFATNLPGPARLQELDLFAFNTDARYAKNVKTLAAYLNKEATNDYERARVVFAWIARNIRYNDHGYNAGNFGDNSVEVVLRNRLSVCDGYARLYKALGEEMGLKVEIISGYAKGYGYSPGRRFNQTNHAWNSVYLNGSWRLVDATWGSGSARMVNGKLKTIVAYNPYWFDVDPHAFLFSHLPKDPKWQQIEKPITLAQYEKLTSVEESLFKLGVDASEVLTGLTTGKLSNIPTTWNTDLPIKIEKAPLHGKLQPGKSYFLSFTVADDVELLVLNNKQWFYFDTKGTSHIIQLKPAQGSLAVMARKKGSKGNYSYFLEYKVGG